MERELALIGVPSSAGARQLGQELAPRSLRNAGLLERLRSADRDVIDCGDLPVVAYRPDSLAPRRQNLPLVVDILEQVARSVDRVVGMNRWPLIVGGDCTITLGVLAGMTRHFPSLGLLYFDGDIDLNTPQTSPSGIFDGMVMSHIIGGGLAELHTLGGGSAVLAERNITLFGYCVEAGGIDPAELDRLASSALRRFPADVVRGRAREAAEQALNELKTEVDRILVHFDVDVVDFDDFPAADLAHRGGVSLAEAEEVLGIWLTSPKVVGLTVTEFNALRDSDGVLAARLVSMLDRALAAGPSPS